MKFFLVFFMIFYEKNGGVVWNIFCIFAEYIEGVGECPRRGQIILNRCVTDRREGTCG